MCPFLFYRFTVGSSNASRVIERILRLAGCAVTRKVKFRDIVGEFKIFHIEVGMVLGETFEVMNRPLAGNVVRDGDTFNSDVLQDRGEDVVCINVARSLCQGRYKGENGGTYRSPR